MYRNPGTDFSTWEQPEAASECALWLATRDPSYSGNVVTIDEIRAQMTAA
jgi:hypothetical protein